MSNSTHGEGLTDDIVTAVAATGNFDQYTILAAILNAMAPHHAAYWRKIGDGVRSGNDPRRRCACGALACVYSGAISGAIATCGTCPQGTEELPW